jgi:hypothetical protein
VIASIVLMFEVGVSVGRCFMCTKGFFLAHFRVLTLCLLLYHTTRRLELIRALEDFVLRSEVKASLYSVFRFMLQIFFDGGMQSYAKNAITVCLFLYCIAGRFHLRGHPAYRIVVNGFNFILF